MIYVGVVNADNLRIKALEQWYRDVPIRAERGEILDRNGVVLAGSQTVYTLYARPVEIPLKAQAAGVLSEALELNYEKLADKLNSRASEITLKRGVTKEKMLEIVDSGVPGIYVSEDIERVYPYGDFMTQILGFTSSDIVGQTGLEAYYESYLKGTDGYVLTAADLVGAAVDRQFHKDLLVMQVVMCYHLHDLFGKMRDFLYLLLRSKDERATVWNCTRFSSRIAIPV